MLAVPEGKKLYDVPYFKDGAIIKVSSRNPKKPEAQKGMSSMMPYLQFNLDLASPIQNAITLLAENV